MRIGVIRVLVESMCISGIWALKDDPVGRTPTCPVKLDKNIIIFAINLKLIKPVKRSYLDYHFTLNYWCLKMRANTVVINQNYWTQIVDWQKTHRQQVIRVFAQSWAKVARQLLCAIREGFTWYGQRRWPLIGRRTTG